MRTVRIPTSLAGQDIALRLPADTDRSALWVSTMGQTQIIEIARYQVGAPTRFEFTASLPFGTRWHRLGSADMALETLTGQRVALLTNTFGYTGTGDPAGFTLTNSGTTLIGTFTVWGEAMGHGAACGRPGFRDGHRGGGDLFAVVTEFCVTVLGELLDVARRGAPAETLYSFPHRQTRVLIVKSSGEKHDIDPECVGERFYRPKAGVAGPA